MSFAPADFEKQVIERSATVPVLVDFWAPWCGPCRHLGPVLERLASQANGRWELVKVNTEEDQQLAMAFNISSIPAVKLFINGEVADEFVGALPEAEIRRFIDAALPSPHGSVLAEARQALDRGLAAEAARLLEPVVDQDPGNVEARLGLAEASLFRDPERTLALARTVAPHDRHGDRAQALVTLAELARLAANPGALPPGKGREPYLAGAGAVRAGNWSDALESFIHGLQVDKGYMDHGARTACKAIFQFLGIRHAVSEKYWRAFSSALNS